MLELCFQTKNEWRTWLSENHGSNEPIWLIFFKKGATKNSITYDEAVEQALCFGWIDGLVKGIDEEKYKRKFMPRINFQNWSESNQKRVEKLILEKEMTTIGLNKIGDFAKTKQLIWPPIETVTATNFSENLATLLKEDSIAFQNFQKFSATCQKQYIQWVMQAKKEETRLRRMQEAILLIKNNQKNLLK